MTLLEELEAAQIPTDHHESDLYVLATPQAWQIIRKHMGEHWTQVQAFTSQKPFDGRRWFDVPFAYDPFWKRTSALTPNCRHLVNGG